MLQYRRHERHIFLAFLLSNQVIFILFLHTSFGYCLPTLNLILCIPLCVNGTNCYKLHFPHSSEAWRELGRQQGGKKGFPSSLQVLALPPNSRGQVQFQLSLISPFLLLLVLYASQVLVPALAGGSSHSVAAAWQSLQHQEHSTRPMV